MAMLGKKSKDKPERNGNSITLVGKGVNIQGNLLAEGDIRVDGFLEGNLIGKQRVVIGPSGSIQGIVDGEDVVVEGYVNGVIIARKQLVLQGKARVEGRLYAVRLQVQDDALINGECLMGSKLERVLEQHKSPTLAQLKNLIKVDFLRLPNITNEQPAALKS